MNCVSGFSAVMYCRRIVNWTVCLVEVRLCTAGGLWTEMCIWLLWGFKLLADCELNCVSGCIAVMYCWRVWTELCVWLQLGYVLLVDCELNCVSSCGEVMYCWRIVNWILYLVALRFSTPGGLWTELCVCFHCGYVLLVCLNRTVFLVAVRVCTAGGLWTELCV